ncbi:hypothetical protein ONZ45_g9567 [Pleurotus djamor]|nr:hypothetical protein ONZ45_g9567 [Pleurotus djamor]
MSTSQNSENLNATALRAPTTAQTTRKERLSTAPYSRPSRPSNKQAISVATKAIASSEDEASEANPSSFGTIGPVFPSPATSTPPRNQATSAVPSAEELFNIPSPQVERVARPAPKVPASTRVTVTLVKKVVPQVAQDAPQSKAKKTTEKNSSAITNGSMKKGKGEPGGRAGVIKTMGKMNRSRAGQAPPLKLKK